MKMLSDIQLRQDLVKLAFLTISIVGIAAIFAVNPALSTPTFVAVVFSMLFSPWVAAIERRGISRVLSITIIFAGIALVLGVLGFWAASFQEEWLSFKEKAPEHFQAAIQGLRRFEESLKGRYSFLSGVQPTDSLLKWGESTGSWFAENGASMVASILTWILIVPPLTFVLLNEGRAIRQRFFHLVPNRFFESFFLVSNEITTAISDYLRAKLVEALLVGLMTTVGLVIVGSPFAIVLGVAAGLTNIIPYVGPLMGAAPALLISLFDTTGQGKLVPVLMVYLIANVIDTIVIFPLVVAKLVNLHPLLLIAVVAIGQQYYGLIGMLISIPIATACKVIIGEVYSAIYQTRSVRRSPSAPKNQPTIDGHATALEDSA
jgi:putative permease